MDIAAAQELLDRVGRLDYIDLMASGDEAAVPARLQGELPPGVEVVRPGAQGTRTEGLVAAYRLNLAVLSAIALFVGMFLIYQSVTLSVVRRRREIGLLRTLGMTPAQVLVLFLAEGLGQRPGGRPPGPGSGGGPGPGGAGGDDPEPHVAVHAGGGRRSLGAGRPAAAGLGPGSGSHLGSRGHTGPGGGPHPTPGRVAPGGTGRAARKPGGNYLYLGARWPWPWRESAPPGRWGAARPGPGSPRPSLSSWALPCSRR